VQVSLSLRDSVPCVVIRIVFIFRAVVGDAPNHDFGIVAASERTPRVGPIALGLGFVLVRQGPWTFLSVAQMPGCFERIVMSREIAERVDRIAFLSRLDYEFLWNLPVGESRRRSTRVESVAARSAPN